MTSRAWKMYTYSPSAIREKSIISHSTVCHTPIGGTIGIEFDDDIVEVDEVDDDDGSIGPLYSLFTLISSIDRPFCISLISRAISSCAIAYGC